MAPAIALEPGDIVLLFTKGLLEAMRPMEAGLAWSVRWRLSPPGRKWPGNCRQPLSFGPRLLPGATRDDITAAVVKVGALSPEMARSVAN